jgi:hypothetical protein
MDPRQRGLFGAAWTLGLIARFAEGRVDAVAGGSATGPSGMIYRKMSYAQPGFDGEKGASLFPVYHVVAGLAPASGAKRLVATSSAASAVIALAHAGKVGPVLWLANLTGEKQGVKITGIAGKTTLAVVDESRFDQAIRKADFLARNAVPLKKLGAIELGAYAVARIAAA